TCLGFSVVFVRLIQILASSDVCGVPVISSRIVGGDDSVYGKWPWQVAVITDGLCGGSLITEQWVLSAAHCFEGTSSPQDCTVSLGMYELYGSNPHGVKVEVEQIILNPQYVDTGDKGDIALVKLKNPVTFTDYILPICLPEASFTFSTGMECWVTGWGTRASGGESEVMTPLIDYELCDQMYHIDSSISSYTIIIQEEKICAGYAEGGKDSCQGDSGGPLVCKMDGVWIQAGVVSWGEGCAQANRPGVYTLVSAYESWIKSYVPEVVFQQSHGGRSFSNTSWVIVLLCVLSMSLF
uniref:Peptidase S1 domain-containing protein n=1 Tax=Leptobrachium leishanense TaxID=445787 RepID=A0A8C5Q3H0_9ANUR